MSESSWSVLFARLRLPSMDPPRADLRDLQPRILRHGHVVLDAWWRYHDCRNQGWVLYVAAAPGAAIGIAGRRLALRPGRGVLIPPGTIFDTHPTAGVPLAYVHAEVLGLPDAQVLAPRVVVLGEDPVLAGLADQLATATAGAALAALALFAQALGRALDEAPAARRVELARVLSARRAFGPVLDHIEDHLDRPLYVAALARLCGMGPQWFTRRFHAALGCTPAQYIIRRRVAAAAARLAGGDDSIDTIASACGFADRFHLSRSFARITGEPPSRWRRHRQQAV